MRVDLPNEDQGRKLLLVARRELLLHFGLEPPPPVEDRELRLACGGLFATLEREGELRGCIGFLRRKDDLAKLARLAVVAAAAEDPRFKSVSRGEVPLLRIGITVLARPEPMESASSIVIGRHGILVERGSCHGLLLPQVAKKRAWDPERFLSETCRKAELPPESWREADTLVRRFEGVHFEEESP